MSLKLLYFNVIMDYFHRH